MVCRAAIGVCLVLGLADSACAQGVQGWGGQMPMGVPVVVAVRIDGTVAGVRAGLIGVTTPSGDTWTLAIRPDAEVRVTGKAAGPDVLQRGMYIRFIVPVDTRRSEVQGKLEKLTIITPSQEEGRLPGVFHQAPGGNEDPAEAGAGEAAEVAEPEDAASPPSGARAGRADGRRGEAAEEIQTFDIRGQITGIRGQWVTVSARNSFFRPTVRVELADELEISVDVNDYTLAKVGDTIAALGIQRGPQAIEATEVVIKMVAPIGESSERSGRGTSRQGTREGTRQGSATRGDRGGFEVAEEMERGKPSEAQETPAEDQAKKPQPEDQRGEQIAAMLKAKPEETAGKPGLSLHAGGDDPKDFSPCKQIAGKKVLGEFGLPDKVVTVTGRIALEPAGEPKEIKWQLWTYGNVLFLVDEDDNTRYLCIDVAREKQPEGPQEGDPQEGQPH